MTFRIISAGGLGDGLLLTPTLRKLKQQWPNCKTKVYCLNRRHLELFQHNPHIDVLRAASFRAAPLDYLLYLTKRSLFSSTMFGEFSPDMMGKHVTEAVADVIDVKLDDHRVEVFLTGEEELEAEALTRKYENPVVVHVTSVTSANQNWPPEKWEALVRANPQFTFLQLGSSSETRIEAAVDMRGRTTLRQSIAILKYVKSFVGVVSFLAHATNAVGTPGVVLFGPSAPRVWGHPNNINLWRDLRCSPCIDMLRHAPCPYGAPCMSEISVESVSKALQEQTARGARARLLPVRVVA
jgi:ADP-heptose:LPS heptosyltransferase